MPDKKFTLDVPLDASQVRDFKPDRAVKVIAYGAKGPAAEQTVKLDAAGKGVASFTFTDNPGPLKVALGPDTASAEDLKRLQTISVDVPASVFRDTAAAKTSAIPITTYYWGWWWRWCTNFTVTGRVLCPDGTPVVGATVCAFDVDWFWWWSSQEQVGCATTGNDGSFEIDFTRCCGWWPWWWWETREWQLDTYLVERITSSLKDHPIIKRLPKASPKPTQDVFEHILASSAPASRGRRVAKAATANAAFNPSELEPLRLKLQEVLPKEIALPIWPWFPWWPWWDCGANLIFKVTQNCGGKINTIVNETFANTRWDVATNVNVNLTTNDLACCAYHCPDGCPQGDCMVPSDICDINVGSVGGNLGNVSLATQVGLAYPGTQDRPFAGEVALFGLFGDAVTVDYYEFLYSTTGIPGSFVPLPLAAVGGFSRQVLTVLPGPVFSWVGVPFSPSSISDGVINHNVIETIRHYEANHGAQIWDAITHDLLFELITAGVLANGTYYLQLQGYTRLGYAGNLSNPVVLPVCDPNVQDKKVLNSWVITLDNQAPGNTDPTGQLCGIHICTDQPISDLIQVMIEHKNGDPPEIVQGCGMVCISPGDLLHVDFAAYDPDAFLESYGLELLYGVDQSVNLLDSGLAGWSLGPSLMPPVWAPATTLVGPDYPSALIEGAVSPAWAGGSMRLTVSAAAAFPVLPCAYLLQLNVYKRPIVNCDGDYVQQNVSFESFTVQACK